MAIQRLRQERRQVASQVEMMSLKYKLVDNDEIEKRINTQKSIINRNK